MAARDTWLLTDVRTRTADGPVDVAVVDGRITAVGPDLEHPGARVLDGAGRAVLPGLVEPHLHLDKAMLGTEVVGSLEGAVAATAARKASFTPDDVRARATDVLERAHRAGATRVRTPVDVDPTVGLTSLEVLLELREQWADRIAVQVVPFPQEGIAARPGTRDLLVEALRRGADVPGACSYAEDDVDACREHVRDVLDLAQRYGVPVDVHADFATGAGDPRHDLAAEIAATTRAAGLQGHVVLGHVTTLAALDPDRRRRNADALAEADLVLLDAPDARTGLLDRAPRTHIADLEPARTGTSRA